MAGWAGDAAAAGGARTWSVRLTQLGAGPVLYPLLLLQAWQRSRTDAARPLWWALLPVLVLAAAQAVVGVLFVSVHRPLPDGSTIGGFASSFTSGHALAATLGVGMLAHGLRRRRPPNGRADVAVLLAGAAGGLLVGSTRVLLGLHWATDVVASIVMGLLLLVAYVALDRRPDLAPTEVGGPSAHGASPWWWVVPAAAALVPVGLLLATPGPERLKDLLVYQGAGGVAGAGQDVYGFRTTFDMPFTYPPFAALLAEPLSRIPIGLGQVLWTAATLLAAVALARVALVPVTARIGLPLTVAALLFSSPMRSHLRFGQVGVFLVLAVAADLLKPGARWSRGAGLGLAAAVKLTPAVFLPWLLMTRSYGRLRSTLAWLGGATLLGLLLLWPSTIAYLGTASRDTSRFGANDIPGNQSVRGMLLRSALPDHLVQPAWLGLAVLLSVAGCSERVDSSRTDAGSRRSASWPACPSRSPRSPGCTTSSGWSCRSPRSSPPGGSAPRPAGTGCSSPGLPALGASATASGLLPTWAGQLVTDLQGLSVVVAVLVLPRLCSRLPGSAPAARGAVCRDSARLRPRDDTLRG